MTLQGLRRIAPSLSRGVRARCAADSSPFHERYSTAAQLSAMQATIPMNRLGTPDECAGTFLYLASDTMSGYVTSQIVEVNGGQYTP
jgi:3-oxoacyl-[acyl-carrier protein] reductase